MKTGIDIAAEIGNALDNLAALHIFISSHSSEKSQPDLSGELVCEAINAINDSVASLKRVLSIVIATGGGPSVPK